MTQRPELPPELIPARHRGLLVRVLVAVGIAVAAVAAAGVTTDSVADAQTAELQVLSQTPYVAADGAFSVTLAWDGAVGPETTVSARIYPAVPDEAALATPVSGDVLSRFPNPNEPLVLNSVIDQGGVFTFEIPIRSFTAADGRVLLDAAGVYPVVIEVREADGPVSTIRTHLIRLPTETAEIVSLPTNVVINVSSADGLELREVIPILERYPSMPVLVVLEEGVIPQLETDDELRNAFKEALGGRPLTAIPDFDLDPSALAEIGKPELYGTALSSTRQRLDNLGLIVNESVLPLDSNLTATGAQMLGELGVEIVMEYSLVSTDGGSVEVGEGLRVLTIDQRRTLQLRQTDDNNGVLRAHELLAELAVRQRSDRSPVVIGGDELRSVDLNALDVLLSALEQPGLVEAVDVNTATGSGSAIPLRLVERPAQDLLVIEDELNALLADLDTYRTFYVAGGTSPDQFDQGVVASLARTLNQDERAREIGRLRASINDQIGSVSLVDGQSVTLAANSAAIPITVTNDGAGIRQVTLRFQSDRIDVTGGSTQTVDLGQGQNTFDIEVESRSLGLSPLNIEVWTTDGRTQLSSTQYRVRSTAIPGLGFLLSGAALGFLIVWWFFSIRRSRKERREAEAVEANPLSNADDRDADDRDADDRDGPTAVGQRTSG